MKNEKNEVNGKNQGNNRNTVQQQRKYERKSEKIVKIENRNHLKEENTRDWSR